MIQNNSEDAIMKINELLGIDEPPFDFEEDIKNLIAEIEEVTGEVPIWEKKCLTLTEAAKIYNIGINRLRDMTEKKSCPYVLFVGNKRLIKVDPFDSFLKSKSCYSI